MKFSLITVCYNSVNTIEDTIKSVINQTYFNDIDYIVIDGLSTDGTLEVLDNYKKDIRIFSSKDDGIYDAMNKGLSQVKGDIIGFINSDDFYINNFIIEEIANFFDLNNKVDGIYSDVFYVSKNKNKIVRNWVTGSYENNSFKNGWHPAHPTLFLKESL